MRMLIVNLFVYFWIICPFFGPAPLALAEDSISAKPDTVEIDFGSCIPGTQRIDVAFGSIVYKIIGPDQNSCVMMYGGEVENPAWDGFLNKTCGIPTSQGIQSFEKTATGVDFSPIADLCSDTPQERAESIE